MPLDILPDFFIYFLKTILPDTDSHFCVEKFCNRAIVAVSNPEIARLRFCSTEFSKSSRNHLVLRRYEDAKCRDREATELSNYIGVVPSIDRLLARIVFLSSSSLFCLRYSAIIESAVSPTKRSGPNNRKQMRFYGAWSIVRKLQIPLI